MALEVLVVDDEADIRELVSGVLEDEGYAVRTAADSSSALDAIEDRRPSLVLLDVWLQGSRLDGLQLLEQIKRRDPTLPVLMISGHGNLDTAVAAVREGAIDFIEKPFEADRLVHLVDRATETDRLRRENEDLRQQGEIAVDGRPRFATRERFPDVDQLLIGIPSEIAETLAYTASTFVVLTAHDYKYDLPVLKVVLPARPACRGARRAWLSDGRATIGRSNRGAGRRSASSSRR